ncbi:MAG: MFS transporter [Novosphingobium sp.]|nr:MAG: MFS transporter [Novosphingobium sp.]
MPASFAVGWRQVGICFLLLSASGMIASTYSLVAVPLAQEFQPTRMVLMLAMTVYSAVSAVLMPLIGNLADRFSVRRLMIAGGCFLAAGYTAISLATSFVQVLVAFALLIAPANALMGPVAATVLLSRWFANLRGRAIGVAIAGISAGGFAFPLIIQGLLDTHDWRQALQLLSLVLIVWTVPAALLVVERPADRALHPDGAPEAPELARQELGRAPISARQILTDPAFWAIAGTVAIVTAGMKGMITNLAPLAKDSGIDATRAATLISVYSACSFVAKLSFAALADRVGPRTLMFVALGGFAVGIGLLTQASAGYSAIALGVACIGIFGGLMIPIESFIAPRVFGQRAVGRAMGLLSGVILIAMLATPPLFGLIFDLTGSYKGIFWTFCALGIAAMFWLPAIRLHARQEPTLEAAPAE